ncbi:MAG: hypothetical protein K0B00_01360 [Rhodobacteraceae bacterium]|nr:hypothetical protein [Paracoccaceae bacterium]
MNARRARRRGRPRALWVIIVLLASSGVIRVSETAGQAFAVSGAPTAPAPAAICEPPPDSAALLTALRSRETALAKREEALASRAQTITLAQTQLELKLAELIAAEDRLAATLAIADGATESDVTRLVTLYENMKPKEAAALFSEMAPEFAAGFLSRMRPDAAAQVLAGLDPKAAYAISVLIAGRNANAPVQ